MRLKSSILLFILLSLFSCRHSNQENTLVNNNTTIVSIVPPKKVSKFDSAKLEINYKPIGSYQTIKSNIKSDRAYFKNEYNNNKSKALDSASKYIYSKLLNDITPHWYGTPWDFNGHTNTPQTGEIACGYFVSTTLKHLGFNLNRYKMAQQAGLNEAIALQPKSELKIYSNLTFNKLKEKLNESYSDGIYFVGLDNHVGYVLIKNKALYFLHSSYCDNKVVIEPAKNSLCFKSNIYVFAEISTNKKLVKKWIFNDALDIPTS
jgi:hypothetical protein